MVAPAKSLLPPARCAWCRAKRPPGQLRNLRGMRVCMDCLDLLAEGLNNLPLYREQAAREQARVLAIGLSELARARREAEGAAGREQG